MYGGGSERKHRLKLAEAPSQGPKAVVKKEKMQTKKIRIACSGRHPKIDPVE